MQPVNFVWFERKVKEWGCMQALIDFDGWRKWEDFATENGLKDPRDIKTGPRASASRRGRELKSPPLLANASTTNPNNPTPPKSSDTSALDFATAPKKSIGETLAEEEKHLQKEDSPDTIVNVSAAA
jgi:osomolarity two-component system response regulator SSK1